MPLEKAPLEENVNDLFFAMALLIRLNSQGLNFDEREEEKQLAYPLRFLKQLGTKSRTFQWRLRRKSEHCVEGRIEEHRQEVSRLLHEVLCPASCWSRRRQLYRRR